MGRQVCLAILCCLMLLQSSRSFSIFFNSYSSLGRRSSRFSLSSPNVKKHLSDIAGPAATTSDADADTDLHEHTNADALPGRVYFVATPLGNLHDVSHRARRVLSTADLVLAEDTRKTALLLKLLKLPYKPLLSFHEHNQNERIEKALSLLSGDGANKAISIAVVSDAGTPAISDPGYPLAAALAEKNIPLSPVPGPCALVAALSISGFPATPFTFLGFPSAKGRERRTTLEQILSLAHAVVIYEAPHRVLRTLSELLEMSGTKKELVHRKVTCCRELTKKHEEIRRGTLTEIVTWLQGLETDKENNLGAGIRGEFTIVFAPVDRQRENDLKALRDALNDRANDEQVNESSELKKDALGTALEGADEFKNSIISALSSLRTQGCKRSEAVKRVSKDLAVPRSIVYDLALKIDGW